MEGEAKLNDEADILVTLRDLVRQIAVSDYRDSLGHKLIQNIAYRDAVALLSLRLPSARPGSPDVDR